MIPRLYERDETRFRHNGIALLDETLYCHAREVRNGAFDLELEYPNNGRWFKELKEFRFIVAKTNDIWNEHIFRIYDIEKSLENHSVIVRATSKSNDLNGNVITPVDIVDKNAQQALDIMKANIVHPTNYVFNSDITTVASTSWLAQNPLKCLGGSKGSVIDIWGGEIQRGNSTINIYARRGRDNVTTIRPGKGLQGFRMTTSTKGLITQVLPAVTYNNPNTGLDVTHYGTPINSPKIGNYPIVYTEIVDYSSHEGVMPEETIHVVTPEHPTPEEGQLSGREFRLKAERNATNAARSYFTEQNPDCDIPKVTMEVDMMRIQDSSEYWYYKDLETLELTDTLTVWIEKFDIDVLIKVTELVYNVLDETVISIVAGSSKGGVYRDTSQRFDDVSNEIHNIKEEKKRGDKHYNQVLGEARNYFDAELEALETVVRKGADGKNSIFTGRLEPDPTLPVENDIWYKILDDGSVGMYRHNGTIWELILTSADSISSGTLDAGLVPVKNLSASAITTGTLNASLINLINLNANSISTGTISGSDGFWNLNTGILRLGSADGRFSTTDRDGFEVTENNETLAAFGAAGAVVPVLYSDRVIGENLTTFATRPPSYIHIGPGKTFTSISEALNHYFRMGDSGHRATICRDQDTYNFEVYGNVVDNVYIEGLTGAGYLNIRIKTGATLKASFYLTGNDIPIRISAEGTGKLISGGGYSMCYAKECKYVECKDMRVDSLESTIAFRSDNGSTMLLSGIDGRGSTYFGFADWGGTVIAVDNIGNYTHTALYARNGAGVWASGKVPNASNLAVTPSGFQWLSGNNVKTNSSWSPPPVTNTKLTQIFTAATFDTLSYGSSVNSYYGSTAAQNKWTTGMTSWQQARIRMGSAVRDFYSGGSNISVRMRLRRKNSSHGYTSAISPTPSNFSCSMSGAVRGGWTGWGSVSYGTFGTSVDLRLGSNTYSNYAIWDAIQVEVTVTKPI